MKTFGKGGKGSSTHKKQKLNPKAGKAGNTTAGIWLTSHMNSAKFRSNGTHAEEEKAREIKLQEEIDEAKRISLGDSGGNSSKPGQVIELSDGDTEDEEDKKPSAVEESNKPPFGSSKKKPPSERRASKGARNGKSKSPYASTPTNELVGTYCAAVSSKGWGDIFVHDMADELRTRLLDDEQFDRLKQATIDGLLAAAQRVETGDITPPRMDAYCAKIRVYCAQIRSVKPAKRGQKLNVFMLLCPKWIKGQLISLCPYATPVPGFDPNSCSTTRVLRKLTDELDEDEYTTDDVRGDCQCEDGRCKKCTKDEGSARAEVYNRFALFFYVTGGEMSFYNLGGTTTRIKENLVSKLDRHYFHTVFKNGYHLSCATYLVPCFPTFEYGATCITANMKEACDLLQIPQQL